MKFVNSRTSKEIDMPTNIKRNLHLVILHHIFISISVRNLRKININGKNNKQLSKHKNAQSNEYMYTSPSYYLFFSEREAHATGI